MIKESWLKDKETLRAWIKQNSGPNGNKETLEKQIFAFYLLEKLIEANIYFVFKGGTALVLLLENPHRFSTDIDILITKPDLEKVIETFSSFTGDEFIFTKWEEDVRTNSSFPKVHYKFYYSSIFGGKEKESTILLDAVFENNPYLVTIGKEIKSRILDTEPPYKIVNVPSITDIMIDKLTAFAPNTIGVKYFREYPGGEVPIRKEIKREVIKQLFDVNELFMNCTDFTNLNSRYLKLADFEIANRKLSGITYIDCLKDSLDTLLIYLANKTRNKTVYEYLKVGLQGFSSFANIPVSLDYILPACINIIELISKVLCDEESKYNDLFEESKKSFSYDAFIENNNLKMISKYVKINDKNYLLRLIKSLRVISYYFKF